MTTPFVRPRFIGLLSFVCASSLIGCPTTDTGDGSDGAEEGTAEGVAEGDVEGAVDGDGNAEGDIDGAPVECPDGRVPLGEACIIDYDEEVPVDLNAMIAVWGDIVDDLRAHWALREVRGFDLEAFDEEIYNRLLSDEVTSEYDAHWLFTEALFALGDGHVALISDVLLQYEIPAIATFETVTNTGACVVEADEGLIVNQIFDTNPVGFSLGDKILAIDGRAIELAIEDRIAQPKTLTRPTTPATIRGGAVRSFMVRDPIDRVVTVEHVDGSIEDLNLVISGYENCFGTTFFYMDFTDYLFEDDFELISGTLDGDIKYIWFSQFRNEPAFRSLLREQMEDANNHAGVIIDITFNEGGWPETMEDLLSYVADEPYTYARSSLRTGPGANAFTTPTDLRITPDADLHVNVPLVVVLDATTISAGDYVAEALKVSGTGILVGQPPSGGLGSSAYTQLDGFDLINNRELITDLDGNSIESRPTPVDIEVLPRRADVSIGQDNRVLAAIAAIRAANAD